MCSTQDLDNMLGYYSQQQSNYLQFSHSGQQGGAMGSNIPAGDWQSRLRLYGDSVAQLTTVQSPLRSYGGRNDLAAQFAQGLSSRTQRKVRERAMKDIQEGKNGGVDKRGAKSRWVGRFGSLAIMTDTWLSWWSVTCSRSSASMDMLRPVRRTNGT